MINATIHKVNEHVRVADMAALSKIYETAQTVDGKTMSLQYLEALKQIGQSPSTKFVIPMEFTHLLSGITSFAERTFGDGQADSQGGA